MPNLAQLTDNYIPETIDSFPVEPLYFSPKEAAISIRPVSDPTYAAGNIDLDNRPIVKNADGSISTVKSKSFNFDGKEILIPTVANDGSRLLNDDEAISQFRKTGKHLGEFKTTEEANKYAEQLHLDQEKLYRPEPRPEPMGDGVGNKVDKILNKLFRDDDKRYQLWPEKIIREGATAAGKVSAGEVPQWAVDKDTGDVHTSPQMIEKAQEISALAGTGGLAGGADGAALNATPSLRPALKYKDKIYKGKEGQQHQDVIPKELYPEFEQMAMNGEDISHYNFGFMNHKGQFLDREKALEYAISEGLIDAHAGKYGALTSTLMADSSKSGIAIEAMKANPFYSALEHQVSNISQAKMTGEQWLGTLSNKPGVKPEEMQWTGLKDFLEENKGKPVSKSQIEEHLANNKVELKEVQKGTGELKKAAEDLQAAVGNEKITVANHRDKLYADEVEQGLWSGDITPKDLPTNLQPHAEKMLSLRHQQENPTKYHSYQLPGGENYREMLMTLPKKEEARYNKLYDKIKTGNNTREEAQEYAKLAHTSKTDYKSSHWDEPNILAHVRMNDRTIDGKKALHLEEIQSDWHQQGRDKGYANPKIAAEAKAVMAEMEKVKTFSPEWEKLSAKLDTLQNNPNGVPDAPFKKSWHELALKRMIREAAEKGYDRLSWTPGEAQAARYDLSKQIDKVVLVPKNKNTDPAFEYRIDAFKNGERVVTKPANTEAEVADIVGKEVAKKLFEKYKNPPAAPARPSKLPEGYELSKDGDKWTVIPPNQTHGAPFSGKHNSQAEAISSAIDKIQAEALGKHYDNKNALEGLDLKIGGEGMKGFYDQIIPKALEKIGKEHGVKVKQGTLPSDNIRKTVDDRYTVVGDKRTFDTLAEAKAVADHKIHYIDLPQSLKNHAMNKGFPLFSKGGFMLQPVDHKPDFGDK